MTNFDNYYNNLSDNTKKYFKILYKSIPIELKEYASIIIRLKDIDYFCGMKYASKYIYDFKYEISRLDHSIACFLETLNFTNDFEMSLSALYHDCNTPIFSHVIDYLYKDYINQEKTEVLNDIFLLNNKKLEKLLDRDDICIENIINPKQYSIVDNDRPKLCIDRLDGIFLTSMSWTKEIALERIEKYYKSVCVEKNEDDELELCFDNMNTAMEITELEKRINKYCHQKEDMFFMLLASNIIKYCIKRKYIDKSELYTLTEKEFIEIIKSKMIDDKKLEFEVNAFTSMKEVIDVEKIKTKTRFINPLYKDDIVKRLR